jgi:hypothetical protein
MSGQIALLALCRQELRRVEVFLRGSRRRVIPETSTRRSFAGPPRPARLNKQYEGPVIRPFAVSGVTKINGEVRMATQQ